MRIDEITKNIAATKSSKRVGRGNGSGSGKTSGRGTKGQKARSGSSVPARFEGGQTPIMKRIPKKKGFKSIKRLKTFVINLHYIDQFLDKDNKLTISLLKEKGYLKEGELVKILGSHKLENKIDVTVNKISQSAKNIIEAAGGKITII